MREKTDGEKRDEEDELPWDTGMPELSLINLISGWPKGISRVLEVGCGTGTNAVWLKPGGYWLSLVGNKDQVDAGEQGPPRPQSLTKAAQTTEVLALPDENKVRII